MHVGLQAQEPEASFDLIHEIAVMHQDQIPVTPLSNNTQLSCEVYSISWNQYGSQLAAAGSCNYDKSFGYVQIFDIEKDKKPKLIQTLYPDDNSVKSVGYSPDGSLLAIATRERVIRIYNTQRNFSLEHELNVYWHNPSFAFSPDGALFTVADYNVIRMFNVKDKFLPAGTIDDDNVSPYRITFFSGNTYLAVIYSYIVNIYHSNDLFNSFKKVHSFPTEQGYCIGITSRQSLFSSKLAFASRDDYEVRLFTSYREYSVFSKYSEIKAFPSNMLMINSMTFNKDASMLAIAGIDRLNYEGNLKVFLLDKPAPVIQNIKDSKLVITSVSFSPDGKLLAAAGNEGKVWLYNVSSSDVHR